MTRLVHRVVLAFLLTLLPLQWSVAAAAWYGSHGKVGGSDHPIAAVLDTVDHGASQPDRSEGPAEEGHACTSDCHLDDPLWIVSTSVRLLPQHAGPPHFEYFAPTGSHIPAGPERPDRQRAA